MLDRIRADWDSKSLFRKGFIVVAAAIVCAGLISSLLMVTGVWEPFAV